METPSTYSNSREKKRMISTGHRFTRLDFVDTTRELKTSKAARAFPHGTRNHSLDNSKENINYQGYLLKVKSALKIDEKVTISKYLWSLRKEYDKMAKTIKQQESSINIKKKEIEFLRNRWKNETDYFSSTRDKVDSREKQLSLASVKHSESKMQTKILEHIINRMKSDQLKQKNDARLKEMERKEKMKQFQIKDEQILQWDETVHKMIEKVNAIRREYIRNNEHRKEKLIDYETRVEDLEDQQKFEHDRRQRTFQLLSMESNDIMDAKNVILRDVLMVNKVLDKLLENKINDLLNKYQNLQNSYHTIKTETNISDPHSLTTKFFSYREILEEITSTINYYEQKQEQLLKRNRELKEIEKEKITKKLEEEKAMSNQFIEMNQEKQQLAKQAMQKELALKKIKNWIEKTGQVVGIGSSPDYSIRFAQLCTHLSEKSKEVQDQNLKDRKFQSPGIRLKKVIKEMSIQDEKLRRSEAQEANESNMFENIYLSLERKKVKKNQFQIKATTPMTLSRATAAKH